MMIGGEHWEHESLQDSTKSHEENLKKQLTIYKITKTHDVPFSISNQN